MATLEEYKAFRKQYESKGLQGINTENQEKAKEIPISNTFIKDTFPQGLATMTATNQANMAKKVEDLKTPKWYNAPLSSLVGLVNKDAGQKVFTAGNALQNASSFGLRNALATPETRQANQQLAQENPISNTIGNIAGSILPATAIEGLAVKALPSVFGKAGTVTALGKATDLAARGIAGGTGYGAIEGIMGGMADRQAPMDILKRSATTAYDYGLMGGAGAGAISGIVKGVKTVPKLGEFTFGKNAWKAPIQQSGNKWTTPMSAQNFRDLDTFTQKPLQLKSGTAIDVPPGGFGAKTELPQAQRLLPEGQKPLQLKAGTYEMPPPKPTKIIEKDFTPLGSYIKNTEAAKKYPSELAQSKTPNVLQPNFKKETPFKVFPGEIANAKTPPKVDPRFAKETFTQPKTKIPTKNGKSIKTEPINVKTQAVESNLTSPKQQSNILSRSPKQNDVKVPLNSSKVVDDINVGNKPISNVKAEYSAPLTEAKIPTKTYSVTENQRISKFRTNTIERTTQLSETSKKAMPSKEFEFTPETAKEWQTKAIRNIETNKQAVIDKISQSEQISGGVKAHEMSIISKDLEEEAIKTGNYSKLLDWSKTVAEKTREFARGLKGTDTAWEKTPTVSKVIETVQRQVDKVQESIFKQKPKLKTKFDSEVSRYKDAVKNAVIEASKQASDELKINLQLFGSKGKEKLEQMIGKHFTTDPLKRGEIVDKLVKDFGIEGKQAITLAEQINRVFESKFQKTADNYLKRLIKGKNVQDPTLEKIMKLIKAGAYDNSAMRDIVAEKFGMPILSQVEAKLITQEVEALNKLSANSKEYDIKLAQIRRIIEDKLPSSWVDKQRAVKNWSLLGNFKTFGTNIGGNTSFGTVDIATQNTLGNVLDKLASLRTGKTTVGFSSLGKLSKGAKEGFVDGFIDSAGGLRFKDLKGLTTKEKIDKIVEGIQNPINRPIFEATENKFELNRGLAFKGKNKYQQSGNASVKKAGEVFAKAGKVGRVLENALYSSLGTPDRMFKQAYYDDTLNMLTKGNKVSEATLEMKQLAEKIALERTFQDVNMLSNLGRVVNNLPKRITDNQKVANVLEFAINSIAPYMTTPLNIGKRAIEYSPLGLAEGLAKYSKIITTGKATLAEQRYAVDRVARGIAGTVLLMMGISAYKSGTATGKTDSNTDARNFWDSVQINPNSLKIGNATIDLTKIQPVTTTFISGVNLSKSMENNAIKKDKLGMTLDIADNMAKGIGDALEFYTDLPMIQTFRKLFGSGYGNSSLGENVLGVAMEVPKQYYPTAFRQIAQGTDDFRRDTTSESMVEEKLINSVKSSAPGLSKELPIKYSTLGKPMQQYGGNNDFWNIFFNPIKVGKANPTPVQSEIMDLYDRTKSNSVFPNVADRFIEYNGQKKILTGQQRSNFQRIMGTKTDEALSTLFSQGDYKDATVTDADRIKSIQSTISNAKTDAIKEMLVELGIEETKRKKPVKAKIKVPNK